MRERSRAEERCLIVQILKIEGGTPLKGEVSVHGAKNSALPILAAAVLCEEQVVIRNCPALSDVTATIHILRELGCSVKSEGDTVIIDPPAEVKTHISAGLMRQLRSSFIFLGSIAGRMGEVSLCFPGGCELGARPIDLHLMGMRALGMTVEEEGPDIRARAEKGLTGAHIRLRFPSVGATENILLAAVKAKGETLIENAAMEPEITDLADFLISCGAKITGAGTSVIVVEGVEHLHGCDYTVMPDRIVAATWLCCGASAGGDIFVRDAREEHLTALLPLLEKMGCRLDVRKEGVGLAAPERLRGVGPVVTGPYPGFPTDMQAVLMACACSAEGETGFEETIFENRFRHVPDFKKLGADIRVEGMKAFVTGVSRFAAADVTATDLRAGAAMAALALRAEGETTVRGISHIDRGYECFERDLALLGAKIRRV